MSLTVSRAVVTTDAAGNPTGVFVTIGRPKIASILADICSRAGESYEIVTAAGDYIFGPQAIVIQLIEGTEDGIYQPGDLVQVCQTAADAREFLANWYSCDGPAARPVNVPWLTPSIV